MLRKLAPVLLVIAWAPTIAQQPPEAIGPSLDPTPADEWHVARLAGMAEEVHGRWQRLDAACSTDAPFALLYSLVLRTATRYVAADYFDDGNGMVDFSVAFAQLYLDSFDAWRAGDPGNATQPWQEAFAYGASGHSTVLEDLNLAINAHIFYDLGLATWQTGYAEPARKLDYLRVNDLLGATVHEAIEQLAHHYDPNLYLLANEPAEAAFRQFLVAARAEAWSDAFALDNMPAAMRPHYLENYEQGVTHAGRLLFESPKAGPTSHDRVDYCQAH